MADEPVKVVVNCAVAGARTYYQEAVEWDRLAQGERDLARTAADAGDTALANAHYAEANRLDHQAQALRGAGDNAMLAEGLQPDPDADPVAIVPLTKAELDQRAKDQEAGKTLAQVRALAERDVALRASDWTQLPDAPLTDAERTAWTEHRKALRAYDPSVLKKDGSIPSLPTSPVTAT